MHPKCVDTSRAAESDNLNLTLGMLDTLNRMCTSCEVAAQNSCKRAVAPCLPQTLRTQTTLRFCCHVSLYMRGPHVPVAHKHVPKWHLGTCNQRKSLQSPCSFEPHPCSSMECLLREVPLRCWKGHRPSGPRLELTAQAGVLSPAEGRGRGTAGCVFFVHPFLSFRW